MSNADAGVRFTALWFCSLRSGEKPQRDGLLFCSLRSMDNRKVAEAQRLIGMQEEMRLERYLALP